MNQSTLRRWTPALAAVLFLTLGCSVNPATGKRQLALVGEQQEIAMGREADQQISAQMGLYDDEQLQNYIQELGTRLAAESERPDLPWTFRVIDDPIVNAFALPGGFIYVTRGILSHFNSEAELVSVLGHEIGHVTGRHSVEQMSKAQLATIGLGVAAITTGMDRGLFDAAQQGMGLLFLKFGRDDERQADDLGLRYLTRGNYDPNEMPNVFRTLERVSAAQGAGRIPSWLSTHPDPGNRAERIASQINELPIELRQGKVNRDGYIQRLESMPFGENPREGYFIGNTFYHPELRFQIEFPEGWKYVNQRQAVGALSPNQDAAVILTLAQEDDPNAAAREFFNQQGLERGTEWRQNFYYFRTVPQSQQQGRIVGLVGFHEHRGRTYRLLSYTQEQRWSPYRDTMQGSLASFKNLTNRRYLNVEPKRVDAVRLDRAMTLAEFDRRYPSTIDLETLAIVNGVEESARLPAGTWLKRVTGGELPDR